MIAELGGFADCQSIAQTVQYCAQCLIGAVPIGAQVLCDLFQPCVGFMDCFVENCETGCAHVYTY